MSVNEDATLTLTMQAIDDASATLNALRSTIEQTGTATNTMNDSSNASAAKATTSQGFFANALKGVAVAGEIAEKVIAKMGETAAIVGVGLDVAYVKALDSAVAYASQVERVAFVTGLSTEKAAGLISAFRSQGMTADEAASTLQRLEMRLGAFGVSAGKTAAEAAKLEAEIKKGGVAGEQAKIKLEALDNQTGGMVSNMRQLGLTYADVTGKGRSMDELLPSIIDHLKNMTDPMERARLAAQLFGRNYGAIAPLIEAGGAAFAKAEGDATKYGNSLSQQQVDALHSFKAAQEQAKEAIDGFTGDMALMALPIFLGIEHAITAVAAAYQSLNPHVKEAIQTAMGIVAIFGPLLGASVALEGVAGSLGKLAPMLEKFGLGGLAAGVGEFSSALAVILPIIAAVAAAVLILKLAYDHIPAVHQFIDETLKRLTASFNAAISVFRATGDPITALYTGLLKLGVPFQTVNQWTLYLRQAWDYLTSSLKPLVAIVEQSLHSAFVQLQPVMAQLQQAFVQLRPVMDVLGPIFAAMGAAALILLGGAFKALVAFLMTAIPTAIQFAVDIITVLVYTFKFLADIVKNVAAIIMDIVHGDFSQAFADLQKLFFQMGEDIMFIIGSLVKTVVDLVVGLAVTIGATVWGFVKGIVDTFMWLWDQLVGHSIIPDMINGIVTWFESLPTKLLNLIDTLATNMLGAAKNIGTNIVSGIVNGLWNLDSAMSHAIGRAINNVPGIGGQVDNALGLPTYDVGGWVNAPLGQAQLAVVHGGEFIQNSAMIAAGVSASGRSGGGAGGDLIVNVVLDGKVIQRSVSKGLGDRMRLQGGQLGAGA